MFVDNKFVIKDELYNDKAGTVFKDLRINSFRIDWDKLFVRPLKLSDGKDSTDTMEIVFNIKEFDG